MLIYRFASEKAPVGDALDRQNVRLSIDYFESERTRIIKWKVWGDQPGDAFL